MDAVNLSNCTTLLNDADIGMLDKPKDVKARNEEQGGTYNNKMCLYHLTYIPSN